jgi:hypothetical protein
MTTTTTTTPRQPASERIAVRCVDSDVHPTPRRGELVQYIPEPWRSNGLATYRLPDTVPALEGQVRVF